MTTSFNIAAATSAELLTFFNANTGGAQIKKFADRPTAEKRVQKLVDEIAAEGLAAEEFEPAEVAFFAAQRSAEETAEVAVPEAMSGVYEPSCPKCGATLDITSGRIVNRFGKQVLVDEGVFTCHGCSHEWGTADKASKTPAAYRTVRNNMVSSLKLDRRIVHTDTGTTYANACQVWKAGLVSASQGDRLSAVLYGAAKNNDRVVTIINGHTFRLFA